MRDAMAAYLQKEDGPAGLHAASSTDGGQPSVVSARAAVAGDPRAARAALSALLEQVTLTERRVRRLEREAEADKVRCGARCCGSSWAQRAISS